MMLNKIIEDYVVSDQITEEDIEQLKEAGFKTIFFPKKSEIALTQRQKSLLQS